MFLVLIVCQDLFLIALPVVVFSRPLTSMQEYLKYRVYQMNIVFYRSTMPTKMILTAVPHYQCSFKYPTARTISLALSKIQKWVVEMGDFGN